MIPSRLRARRGAGAPGGFVGPRPCSGRSSGMRRGGLSRFFPALWRALAFDGGAAGEGAAEGELVGLLQPTASGESLREAGDRNG
jgi:hypothetical protein